MIQIYADGELICDSRLEHHDLQGLTITTSLNKGGTAEIIMPPGHPAYDRIAGTKLVEIYRDGLLQFRGRPHEPLDDFYNVRTVQCEGEMCFLDDAVSRPYLYQDDPAAIFTAVLGTYNSQVDTFKQFKVGTITVTDPNDYIRLESETAEQVLATVNKLLERCGGYIVFTSDPSDGTRVINWYASLGYRSGQVIEFGENLLDFSRGGTNTELATAVLPYGAKTGGDGARLTIESVNDGKDYIQNDEAVELRGFIIRPVTWDDVTEPANLLRKAQEWLAEHCQIVTTLQLSALDLSYIDKNIDSYQVGDTIRVKSRPHKVDDDFRLTERTEDLLNPENSLISLGKEIRTLTSADVAGDTKSHTELQTVTREIAADYMLNVSDLVQEAEKTLLTLIEQTSEALTLEVAQQYATNQGVQEAISTTMTQLADSFEFLFTELRATVDANDAEAREQFAEIKNYIRFEDGNIILGKAGNEITLRLENDRILFLDGGAEVAYFTNKHLTVKDATFLNSMRIGAFAFIPRANGNLSLVKVGDA